MQSPMKLSISVALAAAALAAAPAFAGKTLDAIKSRGQLVCGVNTGLAGFSAADSQGNWTGLDVDICRAIAAAVLMRRQQGEVRPAHRAAALHRAAVGRDRHPVAQHHLDADPRRLARPALHRHDLLRRPGLHGPGQVEAEERQEPEERDRLRAVGHHHREEPHRLLAHQQAGHQADRVREAGSRHRRVLLRPLRGVHHRRLGPRLDPQQGRQGPEGARDPAGAHLQGAARAGRAPRRRRVLRHRQVGGLRPDRGRGIRHHAGQRRTR